MNEAMSLLLKGKDDKKMSEFSIGGMTEQEADVAESLLTFCLSKNKLIFTRQQLLDDEKFMKGWHTDSKTPGQQLSMVLQKLRDQGRIVFLDDNGMYCLKTKLLEG